MICDLAAPGNVAIHLAPDLIQYIYCHVLLCPDIHPHWRGGWGCAFALLISLYRIYTAAGSVEETFSTAAQDPLSPPTASSLSSISEQEIPMQASPSAPSTSSGPTGSQYDGLEDWIIQPDVSALALLFE